MTQVAQTIGANLRGSDVRFRGVSTDTRTLSSGELFVALQGPNFDGASFVADAAHAGAAGAVVSRTVDTELPWIEVPDTRVALGEIAAYWRSSMPARVVGITGSNGKTTLKEMLASCLSLSANTLATAGNLNNDIGLPLMLLRLAPEHEFAVLEMGANHLGEIAYLSRLARPDVVVITNAGPAHLEGFGSLQGVAQAKGEILTDGTQPSSAVLNADDVFFDFWRAKVEELPVVSFGVEHEADVSASDIECHASGSDFSLETPAGQADIHLSLAGSHNVLNACAAAAVAHALEIPVEQIKRGLEAVEPVSGRLQCLSQDGGVTIYDDSYNANPDSVVAAAEFLAARDGRGILVLGDMAELGPAAADFHRAAGRAAKEAGIDLLYATGELARHAAQAFGSGGFWFPSTQELTEELNKELERIASDPCTVLVKGSRSMRMERVIAALRAAEVRAS